MNEKLKKILNEVDHCSLTCDGWTSKGHNSYFGVTVHFVMDWVLKSYVLALKHVTKQHTADNLLCELREVISEWELDAKVVSVSADGAYNIKRVILIINLKKLILFFN